MWLSVVQIWYEIRTYSSIYRDMRRLDRMFLISIQKVNEEWAWRCCLTWLSQKDRTITAAVISTGVEMLYSYISPEDKDTGNPYALV